MSNLAAAIEWKFGALAQARCNLETGTIEEWNHPTEVQPDVTALLTEYEPIRLQRVQEVQDLEDIRNNPDINTLLSKQPSEIIDHFGQQNNVPALAEQVALLAMKIKELDAD